MGVPTMYQRLSQAWEGVLDKPQLKTMRVFISGSAPLSETLFSNDSEASPDTPILERYGMTEAGMIASNPYPPEARKAKSVGYPLAGVQMRVVDSKGDDVIPGEVGEVWIRGNNFSMATGGSPKRPGRLFRMAGSKAGTWAIRTRR